MYIIHNSIKIITFVYRLPQIYTKGVFEDLDKKNVVKELFKPLVSGLTGCKLITF